MWRAGLSPDLMAWTLNALALALCAGLGARALFDAKWAARLARFGPEPQGEGFAALSAALGGLCLAAHAAALLFTAKWILGGEQVVGIFAAGAAAALAGAWGGACMGRALALARAPGLRTRANVRRALTEAALAAAIAAPWLVWAVSDAH